MLNTKLQTVKAIKYIKRVTGWSTREVGAQSGLCFSTISRMLSKDPDQTRKPTRATRDRVWALYTKVLTDDVLGLPNIKE